MVGVDVIQTDRSVSDAHQLAGRVGKLFRLPAENLGTTCFVDAIDADHAPSPIES